MMDNEPNGGLFLIGAVALFAALCGLLAPEFWANMPLGSGASPRLIRIWSNIWLLIGTILVAFFFCRLFSGAKRSNPYRTT
jgi:hypothetical protein